MDASSSAVTAAPHQMRTERTPDMDLDGKKPGERSSALWGRGGKGGQGRSWRPGGKLVALLAVLALAAPLSATAAPNGKGAHGFDKNATFVDPALLAKAKHTPLQMVRVIIQSNF